MCLARLLVSDKTEVPPSKHEESSRSAQMMVQQTTLAREDTRGQSLSSFFPLHRLVSSAHLFRLVLCHHRNT